MKEFYNLLRGTGQDDKAKALLIKGQVHSSKNRHSGRAHICKKQRKRHEVGFAKIPNLIRKSEFLRGRGGDEKKKNIFQCSSEH